MGSRRKNELAGERRVGVRGKWGGRVVDEGIEGIEGNRERERKERRRRELEG